MTLRDRDAKPSLPKRNLDDEATDTKADITLPSSAPSRRHLSKSISGSVHRLKITYRTPEENGSVSADGASSLSPSLTEMDRRKSFAQSSGSNSGSAGHQESFSLLHAKHNSSRRGCSLNDASLVSLGNFSAISGSSRRGMDHREPSFTTLNHNSTPARLSGHIPGEPIRGISKSHSFDPRGIPFDRSVARSSSADLDIFAHTPRRFGRKPPKNVDGIMKKKKKDDSLSFWGKGNKDPRRTSLRKSVSGKDGNKSGGGLFSKVSA